MRRGGGISAQLSLVPSRLPESEPALWLRAADLVQRAQAAPSVVNMMAAVDAWRAWERRIGARVAA